MWSRNPPQTHHSNKTIFEAKPKLNLAAWFSIKGTLRKLNFLWSILYFLCWETNLPKWREDNFLCECPDSKIFSSNFCRNEKENRHGQNWKQNQHPRLWIKQFQKIPYRRYFIWISGVPIVRKINRSWCTDWYGPSSMVTPVVWWSYDVHLIPLNLTIWLNHHIQYSVPQTFPMQPDQPPRSEL